MKPAKCALLGVIILTLAGCATSSIVHRAGPMGSDTITSQRGIVLKGSDTLSTPGAFQPPVEIIVVAKTDSTNLRLGYAADQVIFNWELDMDQLRVDGGPANGLHKVGAGRIPIGQYVTIKWLVTPAKQVIYVDDQLRFEHEGDYSQIRRGVSVWPGAGSAVTVKSVVVKQRDSKSQ
jgi:hypothetical protein